MIRITAKHANFRRAGIAHPATPTEYADDAFTAEQLVALREEPMLVVETLPDPEPVLVTNLENDPPPPGASSNDLKPADPPPELLPTAPIDVTPSPSGEGVGTAAAAAKKAKS